ncbi:hypothetical protein Kpol_154p1 [Vanderwaltozyma polyspora DSM 70294]|uniref:Uncharacterized protein n=1 Tax=Vanderwaltozyma polyspora (strain ATCC 22028 / DSM 70294 / BCRC 21397 / CBS 2163 / NBRC 10782 / NRRL Y-8283 / UCD 57-17) TaxID=436907 RepID=A7TTU3_VANPO|nr:uncharacterized protein Kpol_154p1 [Vanderwaltozyma polyspora DSM 70294]EDO14313.1 hypothetical protein Kpol_154p1 [Vanderwaltozyma polyspora DSM 70294]
MLLRLSRRYLNKRSFKFGVLGLLLIVLTVLTIKLNETKFNRRIDRKYEYHDHEINEDVVFDKFPRVNESYNIMDDLADSFSPDKKGKTPKACYITLVRNDELDDMIKSIKHLQSRFKEHYKYDWIFLNDEEFTDHFRSSIENAVNSTVKFGLVPKDHWSYPDYISEDQAAQTRIDMKDIIYGDSESYRFMCRYQSGFFWRHPLLDEYDWYWRVEPNIAYYCDILTDPFQYMQDNEKVYGFTITIHEFEETIPTLWNTTVDFVQNHTQYVSKNNLLRFVTDVSGDDYNLCHFWSNFEIANLNFWRSEAYREYFDYLDRKGGFFYERWGDAPVHSIAAALFLPKDKIHFFPEISYYHGPYTNCPIDKTIYSQYNCNCDPKEDFTWKDYSCGLLYHNIQHIEKPKNWRKHTG